MSARLATNSSKIIRVALKSPVLAYAFTRLVMAYLSTVMPDFFMDSIVTLAPFGSPLFAYANTKWFMVTLSGVTLALTMMSITRWTLLASFAFAYDEISESNVILSGATPSWIISQKWRSALFRSPACMKALIMLCLHAFEGVIPAAVIFFNTASEASGAPCLLCAAIMVL